MVILSGGESLVLVLLEVLFNRIVDARFESRTPCYGCGDDGGVVGRAVVFSTGIDRSSESPIRLAYINLLQYRLLLLSSVPLRSRCLATHYGGLSIPPA
jgi:hypothetical protein